MNAKTFLKKRKNAKNAQFPLNRIPSPPEIEHNLPIPVESRGGERDIYRFYPFEKLEVGDSFWVPRGTGVNKLSTAMSRFAKKSGWKFVTRSVGKDGTMNKLLDGRTTTGLRVRGLRVWRIK